MDWGLDDLLMSDFQIPSSLSMTQQENHLQQENTNHIKDDIQYNDGTTGSNSFLSENGNENSPPTTSNSLPRLPSSELSSNVDTDTPDYVSELHQLLSEEDGNMDSSSSSVVENRVQYSSKDQQGCSNVAFNISGNGKEEEVRCLEYSNGRIDYPIVPLLLSPPPAYKDEVCELPYIFSSKKNNTSLKSSDKSNAITDRVNSSMNGVHKTTTSTIPNSSFEPSKTISMGDTFLTISPASIASSPLPSRPSKTSQTAFKSLPISITRLPGNILHSTTIKPARSSSNSFSFLPITPVTVSAPSVDNKSSVRNNSPLLLKALTPTTVERCMTSIPQSTLSQCSITPITSFSNDLQKEAGTVIKRLKSEASISYSNNESLWQNAMADKSGFLIRKTNDGSILSAKAPLESSSEANITLQPRVQTPSTNAIPIPMSTFGGLKLETSNNVSSISKTDSVNVMIALPPAYSTTTKNNLALLSHSESIDNAAGNYIKEKDQNFEAANTLAKSLEALQNSAKPQPGESSVDLMNALSLSILPLEDDLNNRYPNHNFSIPQFFESSALGQTTNTVSSSEKSLLCSNRLMDNCQRPISMNSLESTKCPLDIMPEDISNGSTITIRPILNGGIIADNEHDKNRSEWDSAVVAKLGQLKPCTPPPNSAKIISTHAIFKHSSTNPIPFISEASLSAVNPTVKVKSAILEIDEGAKCPVPMSPSSVSHSSIHAPPPYPSGSTPLNSSVSHIRSSFSFQHASKTPGAMSEADSGVESIDSLSPKDISPISSPSTVATTHSESMLSNCIIPPPPTSSFSSPNNRKSVLGSGITGIANNNSSPCRPTTDLLKDNVTYHIIPSSNKIELDHHFKPIVNNLFSTATESVSLPTNIQNRIENKDQPPSITRTTSSSKSVLTTLLSTIPKPTKSSALLTSLLNSQASATTSACLSSFSLSSSSTTSSSMATAMDIGQSPIFTPTFADAARPSLKRTMSVVAINPNDMILSKEEKCKVRKTFTSVNDSIEMELATFSEFQSSSFDEPNMDDLGDQPILRSALEDMDTSRSGFDTIPPYSLNRKITTHCTNEHPVANNEPAMVDQGQKLVSSWDTDLHLRLKQLDTELNQVKGDIPGKISNENDPIRAGDDKQTSLVNALKIDLECNSAYNDMSNISSDLEGANKVVAPKIPVRTLLCQYCNEEFESNAERNLHKRKAHSRRHLCAPCDMVFASSTKLERHLLTHKSTKDHKCQICGKAFRIERNLILHQKVHLGQRDYVCDICGKSYVTKSGLLAHQKQNHSPPNESNCGDEAYVKGSGFVCKDKKCEKRHFATRYDLEQHR